MGWPEGQTLLSEIHWDEDQTVLTFQRTFNSPFTSTAQRKPLVTLSFCVVCTRRWQYGWAFYHALPAILFNTSSELDFCAFKVHLNTFVINDKVLVVSSSGKFSRYKLSETFACTWMNNIYETSEQGPFGQLSPDPISSISWNKSYSAKTFCDWLMTAVGRFESKFCQVHLTRHDTTTQAWSNASKTMLDLLAKSNTAENESNMRLVD